MFGGRIVDITSRYISIGMSNKFGTLRWAKGHRSLFCREVAHDVTRWSPPPAALPTPHIEPVHYAATIKRCAVCIRDDFVKHVLLVSEKHGKKRCRTDCISHQLQVAMTKERNQETARISPFFIKNKLLLEQNYNRRPEYIIFYVIFILIITLQERIQSQF